MCSLINTPVTERGPHPRVGGLTLISLALRIPKFGVPALMRGARACRKITSMERRLVVEFEQGSPPSGRVIAADGSSIRFAGWTELAQALEPDDDEAPPAPQTPPG